MKLNHIAGLDPLELCWLAGLLEAEGSFCKPFGKCRNPIVRIGMTDLDVVLRVSMLLGSPAVQSWQSKLPNRKCRYDVRVSNEDTPHLMRLLYPLMSRRRRSQITVALAAIVYKEGRCKVCGEEFRLLPNMSSGQVELCSDLCRQERHRIKSMERRARDRDHVNALKRASRQRMRDQGRRVS